MNRTLIGKTISNIEVLQPKSLNLPVDDFTKALTGAKLQTVKAQGKWLVTGTTQGWLLLNLGMAARFYL